MSGKVKLQYTLSTMDSADAEILCRLIYHNSTEAVMSFEKDTLAETGCCPYPNKDSRFIQNCYAYVIKQVGTQIYFVPRWWVNCDHIAIYNKGKQCFQYIPLQMPERLLDDKENQPIRNWWCNDYLYINSPRFQKVYQWGDSLFCIPETYPGIVRIQAETNRLTYYDDFVEEVLQISKKSGRIEGRAFSGATAIGSKVYLTCRYADLMVEFDMETCRSRVILLSECACGNLFIQLYGKRLALFSLEHPIITLWDSDTEECTHLKLDSRKAASSYLHIAVWRGSALMCTLDEDGLPVKADLQTGAVRTAEELRGYVTEGDSIISMAASESTLYFVTNSGKLCALSESGKYREAGIVLPESELLRLQKQFDSYCNWKGLTENSWTTLEDFLNHVRFSQQECTERAAGASGQRIYTFLKRGLSK